MATTGGHRLKAIIRKALAASGVENVKVGFFKHSKYNDGTPVAAVAAWNEFGTKSGGWGGPIPERPFFRQALLKVGPDVEKLIREKVNTETLAVDGNLAESLGEMVASEIRKSILDGKFKPLAAATLAARQRPGFRGPLDGLQGNEASERRRHPAHGRQLSGRTNMSQISRATAYDILRLPELTESAIIKRRARGDRSERGIWEPGVMTSTPIRVVTAPLEGDQRAVLPEGIREEDVRSFWTLAAVDAIKADEKDGDIIEHNSISYRAIQVDDWIGFRAVLAVRPEAIKA